jgi:hypothetical protein
MDDVLAWQAGDVRTCAAEWSAFDQRGAMTLAGDGPGHQLARSPAAEDEVLVVFNIGASVALLERYLRQNSELLSSVT